MTTTQSQFVRKVLRHCPPGALYYFLEGGTRHGLSTRAPVRGAFRVEPFEHPTANPGLYRLRYCRDRAGQDEVATREYLPVARVLAQDTAQWEAARVFAAFRSTVQKKAPPEADAYSLVSCDGAEQHVPDAGRRLTLREPFQFPQEVMVGLWEVRYHRTSAPDAEDLDCKECVRVEIVEPLGFGDPETLYLSMEGRSAWLARQHAAEQAQLDLLTSAVQEMQSLRGVIADLCKHAMPSPVDYSPVLTQIIAIFRELWQAASSTQATAAPQAGVSSASATAPATADASAASLPPSRKRRRRRRRGRGQARERDFARRHGFRSMNELRAALGLLAMEGKLPFGQATTAARR